MKRSHKKVSRSVGGTIALALLIALVGVLMALPMIYIISSAFKPLEELFLFPPRFLPQNPTLSNFKDMASMLSSLWVTFDRYVYNSVVVSLIATLGYLFIATLAAYPLAKHQFCGKKLINEAIIIALMFNTAVTGLVQYLLMSMLKMIDTYSAMILPSFASTMGVFLCVQYLSTLPDVMLEAAKIDGAGEFRIFFNIVLPNIKPVLFTILIFQFQSAWNISPSNVVYREELKTLPLVLSQLSSGGISRAGAGSAAALIMIIPPIVVFILSQSNVMETMTHSGIKD